MGIREAEPLRAHTTFKLGGPATLFAQAEDIDDLQQAAALASERGLPLKVLGGGSNLLVPDEGVEAIVVRYAPREVTIEDELLIAAAGARWDEVVRAAARAGLWGIENLAGIPGTVGGAVVQNIGAYGAELSETFAYAEVFDRMTGMRRRVFKEDARFAYRMSAFKQSRQYIVLSAAFMLSRTPAPRLDYKDLRAAYESGELLASPDEIAQAVRAIRAKKFPDLSKEGTAGSFFKNPVIPASVAEDLLARYPLLPHFAQPERTVKLSLAWLLDHALSLKGFSMGGARLFERQPLVIATDASATAHDVDALAREVALRVHDAIGVTIEREVETFAR